MLKIDIPGFGSVRLEYLVSDFNGTLATDGILPPNVKDKLNALSEIVQIFVLTSDEFGRAKEELKGVKCKLQILTEKNMDAQKGEFVNGLNAEKTVTLGNGFNDRKMVKNAEIGIVVMGREGCAAETLAAADVVVANAEDALDLLLNPKRLKATLKF